jgi:DAK2 domain fusion protein YloV
MTLNKKETFFLRGSDLRNIVLEACNYFDLYKESINGLNVFPVPDGDTGTNMSLTMNAAAKELQKIESDSVGEVAKILAQSSLMGARGNSGVILSQLFRGVARGLSGKDEAQLSEVGKAFQYGIVYAYNAVSKPVEGTILTVAREIAKGSREAVQTSLTFIDLLRIAIESGRSALERTPELLPVLKEAGVVDAGGLGLVVFLEGCLQSMLKCAAEEQGTIYKKDEVLTVLEVPDPAGKKAATGAIMEEYNPDYPYCTELLMKGSHISSQKVRQSLEEWGDSLLVAGEGELVKVHIHTAHPGNVLEICLLQGSIHDIKIDNMIDQYKETQWSQPSQDKEKTATGKMPDRKTSQVKSSEGTPAAFNPRIGIVAISSGEGLASVFASLGADKIVSGGQSMNPSVKEIIDAITEVPADKVIVLPNNSNIRLSAQQASELVEKEVMVVDTRSIPQGFEALLALDRARTINENYTEMCKRAPQVKTGEVTYATRDAVVNNVSVKKGDIIGICDDCLLVSGETVASTTMDLIRAMLTGEDEVLTLFYGQDINDEQARELAELLSKEFPEIGVELQYGGQPLYYYLVSVE